MLKEKLRSQVLGGCLQDFKDHLSGNYKGFYITLNACAGRYIFTVNAYSPNDAGNQQLNTYLQQQKERVKQILDEPTEGIQPSIIQSIGEAIKRVNKELGITVFIVEQYLEFVLGISDSLYLMEKGQIVLQGNTADIPADEVQKMMTE